MKSDAAFRRHPLGEVVARANDDWHPAQVVPIGRFGAGVWTGHPIGLFIASGLVLIGLIGIPEWRWFFGASVVLGGLYGYFLWRRQ